MNVYKALFGIASVALGLLALLGSGVFASRDHQESDESETPATVQFDQNDVASTRDSSQSRTRRESAKHHVDPIFRTP
ncbi:hypothetical protein E2L06_09880 [Haloterrigena sp. H1]|uniref:hypothetical protein n=1 Tax=Haloterrigena sp. H1 TaxID=2552943 RepID=UPI00110E755A|nr:hypothetical protein [Haloterrigena sp. H1]TMT86897.1 hypothetical protein E2L06_09880 [Haloterrigena sp. H1]